MFAFGKGTRGQWSTKSSNLLTSGLATLGGAVPVGSAGRSLSIQKIQDVVNEILNLGLIVTKKKPDSGVRNFFSVKGLQWD